MVRKSMLTTPNDGFTIRNHTDLAGFVEATTDGYGEYIHCFPDPEARELRLYRSVEEVEGVHFRDRTVLENVRFSLHTDRDLQYLYLCDGEAASLLTWLSCLDRDAGELVTISYYEHDEKGLFEGTDLREEHLVFDYRLDDRTHPHIAERREVHLFSTYRTGVDVQMLARFTDSDVWAGI